MFTRKSLLQPGEFLISSAKRLLQQYRHEPDKSWRTRDVGFGGVKLTRLNDKLEVGVDPIPDLGGPILL